MSDQPQPGQIAISRSGRDRGRAYLILKIASPTRVFVADGQIRTVEKPKQKNIRHLVLHQAVVAEIARKLSEGQMVTNQELALSLSHWQQSQETE